MRDVRDLGQEELQDIVLEEHDALDAPWGYFKSEPHRQQDPRGPLKVWEEPRPSLTYVVGGDVATGAQKDLGQRRIKPGTSFFVDVPDFSAVSVIELETARHVASWHGLCGTTEFASVLVALGLWYNSALVACEVNGPGAGVVDIMQKVYRYPRQYRRKVIGSVPNGQMGQLTIQLGWFTDKVNRPLLVARGHEWIGSGGKTPDAMLVKELRTMQIDPTGKARAMLDDKDDRVMAHLIALQARFELLYGRRGKMTPTGKAKHLPKEIPDYHQMVWDHKDRQAEISERNRGRVVSGWSGRFSAARRRVLATRSRPGVRRRIGS